jgi:hypothetical protein
MADLFHNSSGDSHQSIMNHATHQASILSEFPLIQAVERIGAKIDIRWQNIYDRFESQYHQTFSISKKVFH